MDCLLCVLEKCYPGNVQFNNSCSSQKKKIIVSVSNITTNRIDVSFQFSHVDLGYCWAREVSKFGCCFLPRSRLLCSCE